MKYYILIISLAVLFFGVPFFYLGIVSTGVSITYETENRDCISLVTGVDFSSSPMVHKKTNFI